MTGSSGQVCAILKHLQEGKTLSSIEAFKLFGVTRLSAHIYNLRRAGYNIVATDEVVINRYGKRSVYARYRLHK